MLYEYTHDQELCWPGACLNSLNFEALLHGVFTLEEQEYQDLLDASLDIRRTFEMCQRLSDVPSLFWDAPPTVYKRGADLDITLSKG